MIKSIIYDFDGVICDSVDLKTEAFSELYKFCGPEVQEQVVKYHLENGGVSRFEKFKYFQNKLLGKEIDEAEIEIMAGRFAALVKEKVVNSAFIKGADLFIREYAPKVLQFICTGTPEYEIKEICRRRDISKYFEGIYGSPKNKTEIIEIIIAKTRLKPSEFLYFGDAMTDYQAANDVGVSFIGVESPFTIFPENILVMKDFSDKKLLTELLG